MKLLWLTVSGEYAQQLSGDLIAAGYSATEIASTGDFLHYGNTILLLCRKGRRSDRLHPQPDERVSPSGRRP